MYEFSFAAVIFADRNEEQQSYFILKENKAAEELERFLKRMENEGLAMKVSMRDLSNEKTDN